MERPFTWGFQRTADIGYLAVLGFLTAIAAFTVAYPLGLRGALLVFVGAIASLVLASIGLPQSH